ncbi:diguanylate cyclase [Sneathiella chungangensis]|uniref:diguanylate cyclase n=1 Tax=Sneathiella chungangensis TaxID=1418234 RepID=A0A845MD39_9PROT|nr:GGDEF domain-containing protein [Sneathiella chungangensis]MZR21581.1 diguanylate cyclase [Sneathiella chungangensis]
MSSPMPHISPLQSGLPMGFDAEIGAQLEDLSAALKTSLRRQAPAKHWQLINRIIAYAASAEQHISEQQERIRELEALSTTDELTGLHNRRGLQDFMTRVLAMARRHHEEGVLAFLDLNDFKDINDRYGHNAGDDALCLFAETIRRNLRTSDFVARIGGDEFVFVLTRTDEENGRARAFAIQREISATSISARGRKVFLKASMGIVPFDGNSDFNELMSAADLAMYENKKANKKAARRP